MNCCFFFYIIGYVITAITFGYMYYIDGQYFNTKKVLHCMLIGFGSWAALVILLIMTLRKHFVK